AEAWAAVAADPTPRFETVLTEAPGLLSSPFPVVELGAATVTASLLAAAELQRARSGRAPHVVAVDGGHIGCALRSERYARVGGSPAGASFHPLSRFFRTSDGWIRLHANYPWHRERLLRVL